MSRRALTLVLVALPLVGFLPDVAAQSGVGCTAQLSPTAMGFGNISPQVSSGTTRLLGDVVVRCTNGRNNPPNSINVSIGMSAGNSGSVAQRQMRSTGQGVPLLYNLYQDPALAGGARRHGNAQLVLSEVVAPDGGERRILVEVV